MPPTRQTLRYSEIVSVDLADNQIQFADATADGHRVQVPIAIEDLNLYFKWAREQGSDRPVGYLDDISGFKECLNTCFSDGFTDIDGIASGLTFTSGSLANADNSTGTINDIVMAYVLYKVYGTSTYNTANKVYNSADALNMLANADVSFAIGASVESNNARGEAIDQMFRDLLASNPGRFFDANGTQLPGIFETNTDVSGAGSWQMIVDDIIQIQLKFVFQQQVSRRVVNSQQHPTNAGGTSETVKEEVILPAGHEFMIRLQLKGTAARSQRRIDQLANGGGGGGGGGGGVSGWTIIESTKTPGVYTLESFVGTLSTITTLPTTWQGQTVTGTVDSLLTQRNELQSLFVPVGYTEVGASLCSNCPSLSNVSILAPLEVLPSYCFYGCDSLSTFSMNVSNLNTIGQSAFFSCSNLVSFPVSSNLTTLNADCFKHCISLSSFILPASLTTLSEGCFWNTAIGTITIPPYITDIPNGLFVTTKTLSNITLPNTLIRIGEYALQDTSLPKLILPSTLQILDNTALCQTTLYDITIPGSCVTIGSTAFFNTSTLQYVYFEGSNVPSMGVNAFTTTNSNGTVFYPSSDSNAAWESALVGSGWTSNLIARTYELTTSNNTVTGYTGTMQNLLYIPTALGGVEITTVGTYAFEGNMNIITLALSPSITTLEVAAFKNCENMTSISIPGPLAQIKDEAFSGCSGLTSLTIPSSVTSIGVQSFYSCTGLVNFTFPLGITQIPENCIAGSYNLSNITIPDGVTSIGDYAFYGCTALTNVGIPSALTTIGMSAFENCSALTLIFKNSTLPTFGTDALKNTNPSGVITIPANADLSAWQTAVITAGWTGTVVKQA